jgi:hypothetical protein
MKNLDTNIALHANDAVHTNRLKQYLLFLKTRVNHSIDLNDLREAYYDKHLNRSAPKSISWSPGPRNTNRRKCSAAASHKTVFETAAQHQPQMLINLFDGLMEHLSIEKCCMYFGQINRHQRLYVLNSLRYSNQSFRGNFL